MQTSAFTKNLLSGGIASLYLYFVPNRLLWDDWVPFIAQDEAYAGTFPTSAQTFPELWDKGSASRSKPYSALFRRAYKLCYNEFFGNEQIDKLGNIRTYYSDITDDEDVIVCRTRNTEQFAGRLQDEGAIGSSTFDATTVPIDLNDFYRQMMNSRSKRKANMSGDKYVDAMRRMGVELDWRVQNAPEFLGKVDRNVMPVKTFATADSTGGSAIAEDVGHSVARYETTMNLDIRGKRFAEHGQIVGMFQLRPHLINNSMVQMPDSYMQDITDWYLGDNTADQDQWIKTDFTGGLTDPDDVFYAQRFSTMRNGTHVGGLGNTWAITYVPDFPEAMIYPDGDVMPIGDELETEQLGFQASWITGGQTPIRPNAL